MKMRHIACHPFLRIMVFAIACFALYGCGSTTGGGSITVAAGYKPPFLPVIFRINNNGVISIAADKSITTPLGDFSVEAGGYPSQVDGTVTPTVLVVIIRHKLNSKIVDSVFDIATSDEQIAVTTNGVAVVKISAHQVYIDASQGVIDQIVVQDSHEPTPTPLA